MHHYCVGASIVLKTTSLKIVFPGILSIAFISPVFAQSSDTIEEVVVMATKREQTLQEVPIAVSVVNARTMLRRIPS